MPDTPSEHALQVYSPPGVEHPEKVLGNLNIEKWFQIFPEEDPQKILSFAIQELFLRSQGNVKPLHAFSLSERLAQRFEFGEENSAMMAGSSLRILRDFQIMTLYFKAREKTGDSTVSPEFPQRLLSFIAQQAGHFAAQKNTPLALALHWFEQEIRAIKTLHEHTPLMIH